MSVILACRHLPLKIILIAKIIAQNHCYRFGAVIEKKMTTDSKCVHSPSGHHQFKDIDAFNRDDSGFYLNCMHCNQTVMFDVDTEEDFYYLFGFDTDDDY